MLHWGNPKAFQIMNRDDWIWGSSQSAKQLKGHKAMTKH